MSTTGAEVMGMIGATLGASVLELRDSLIRLTLSPEAVARLLSGRVTRPQLTAPGPRDRPVIVPHDLGPRTRPRVARSVRPWHRSTAGGRQLAT